MIVSNMKVGDVFEDGGLHFEVQAVLPDGNYISRRIETPVSEGIKPEEKTTVRRKKVQ